MQAPQSHRHRTVQTLYSIYYSIYAVQCRTVQNSAEQYRTVQIPYSAGVAERAAQQLRQSLFREDMNREDLSPPE